MIFTKSSVCFLIVMSALVASVSWAGPMPSNFDEAGLFYDRGTLPETLTFSENAKFDGWSFYSNVPATAVEMYSLIYVDSAGIYYGTYFANPTTSSWGLEDFIRAFKGTLSTHRPLGFDTESNSLKTVDPGTGLIFQVSLREVVSSDAKRVIASKFACVSAAGCNVPYAQGSPFQHYNQNDIISYSYFELSNAQ